MAFKREIGGLDPHRPKRPRLTEAEVRLVQHLYREIDRFRPEVDHQRLALEIAVVVGVHLHARPAAVNLFGDDAAFGKDISDLIEFDFEGDGGHKHRGVDSLFLGFLCIGLERRFGVSSDDPSQF